MQLQEADKIKNLYSLKAGEVSSAQFTFINYSQLKKIEQAEPTRFLTSF